MSTGPAADYDVIVVGLGALGAAATWQLARRGLSVLGLERYHLAHTRGASHGDSRIIRLSYHTPAYVRSAARAFDAWSQLERDSGERVVVSCGGVDVFPPGAAIEAGDYLASMDAAGVRYDVLDRARSAQRWPGLSVPEGALVLQQRRTGIVAAGEALRVLHRQAHRFGAELRDNCPVTSVRDHGDMVSVQTASGDLFRARHVVVAADGWTNDVLDGLLPDGGLPLVTTQEYVVHFGVEPGTHLPGEFPVWIWMDDPSYYGFPAFGEDSVKVGQDCGGQETDPDLPPTPDPEYIARLTAFVRARIPAAGPVIRTTRCLYTLTPDRDFILGPVPGHERVLVAAGAAHGFKFAPWFGTALADLVQTAGTELDIAAFAVNRPALTEVADRRWLV